MADCYVGEIRMFGGSYAPSNWALCNGQTLAVSDYPQLYSLIGTTYGGSGGVTFCVPDLRGALPIGQGQGSGLTPRTLGQRIGTDSVTLTETQMPSHNHSVTIASQTASSLSPAGAYYAVPNTSGSVTGLYMEASSTLTTTTLNAAVLEDTGNTYPHYNVMPCLPINYIIALAGDYPVRP